MRRRVRRRDERTTRPPSAIVAPGRLLARTCTLPRPHAQSRPAGDSRAGRSPRRPLTNKNIRLRPSFVALYMVFMVPECLPGIYCRVECAVPMGCLCLRVCVDAATVLFVLHSTLRSHCSTLSHCTLARRRTLPCSCTHRETRPPTRDGPSTVLLLHLDFRIPRIAVDVPGRPCWTVTVIRVLDARSVRKSDSFRSLSLAAARACRHCACRRNWKEATRDALVFRAAL